MIAAIFLASAGGEIALHYLKKLLVSEKTAFSFDVTGFIERPAIACAILAGRHYYWAIPFIIILRAFFFAGKGTYEKIACIINREEPAIEFQKIRLKSEISVPLVCSPLIGILIGSLAKIL